MTSATTILCEAQTASVPECVPSFAPIRLAAVARRHVLFRSLRCIPDGMPFMVMRQMRLIRRRQNIFRLLKLGSYAMMPCGVLVMFGRLFMKFA
jgi:hypothetical protein